MLQTASLAETLGPTGGGSSLDGDGFDCGGSSLDGDGLDCGGSSLCGNRFVRLTMADPISVT